MERPPLRSAWLSDHHRRTLRALIALALAALVVVLVVPARAMQPGSGSGGSGTWPNRNLHQTRGPHGVVARGPALPPDLLRSGFAARRAPAAITYAVGQDVDISRTTGNQNEPTIAVNPFNPDLVVALSNDESLLASGGGLFEGYSTDGGITWHTQSLFTSGATTACCDPQLTFDRFGNLFLTYLGQNQSADNAMVALSTDSGQTFSRVWQLTTSGSADQPSIGVGPSGTAGTDSVWVSVNDSGTIVARGAPVTGLGAVGTWGTTFKVPGTTAANASFGSIAVGPHGQVLVDTQSSDHNNTGQGPTAVLVNLKADGLGAGGFSAPITAATTQVGQDLLVPSTSNNYGIDAEANMAWDQSSGAHGGRVYLAYLDSANPTTYSTHVYLRYSDTNGATWSAPLRVDDDTGPNSKIMPAIAIDRTNGSVGLSWYDSRASSSADDTAQLYAAVSMDGGVSVSANFSVARRLSNAASSEPPAQGARPLGFGDFMTLDYTHGILQPVWADNSNDITGNPDAPHLDIATARVLIGETPAHLQAVTTGLVGLTGGPFAEPLVGQVTDGQGTALGGVSVTFTAPGSGASATFPNGATALTDVNGQTAELAATNQISGTYVVTATVSGLPPVTIPLTNRTPSAFTYLPHIGRNSQ